MLTVDLKNAGVYAQTRAVKRRAAAVSTIQAFTQAYLGAAVAQSIVESPGRPPVNTGMYRRAFFSLPHTNGSKIFNGMPYAPIIEHGRRPGKFPPIDVIANWLAMKNFKETTPKGRKRQVLKGRTVALRTEDARRQGLAFVVARAIARRGLEAKGVMTRAYRTHLRPKLIEELKRALANVAP